MASPGLRGLQSAIKALAMVVGGTCTVVSFASLVGAVTSNPWARGIVALFLTIAIPVVLVDRALLRNNPPETKLRRGRASDLVAMVWMAAALLFVGLGQPVTGAMLVREGDRLAQSGHDLAARGVYLLSGVRPVDGPAPPVVRAPDAATSGGP